MANRSYLDATNVMPGLHAKADGQVLTGISEWNYAIPLVFKLLLSGSPKTCPSSIWSDQGDVALGGDYAAGVSNLESFLAKVTAPAAQPLITEALEFLKKPESQNRYFVLECAEIFAMVDTPPVEQNLTLLANVQDLRAEMDAALQAISAPPVQPSASAVFLSKLLGRAPKPPKPVRVPMDRIQDLGLGDWSHELYFDFGDDE